MSDSQWQRVQSIFKDVLDLEPEARAAFLDEACANDESLRREVESLLEHDITNGAFMHPPGPYARLAAENTPDPRIGTRIGRYEIQRVIASGGMGTVYLARQDRPQRDVALKVLNTGLPSASSQRRFDYESEILARLRHPHIAQIFDAGVHDESSRPGAGLPYFAMEYIAGAQPITKYAGSHRLSIRARLELFTDVCDAAHHGNQRGIIHRDLKPGNILVDDAGHVKIIDFGVARSTDSDVAVTTMHTDVGQLIGTLAYMSPEQCDADPLELDIRSDVYSLGVVLYELLCGRLPYDIKNAPIFEATRIIRHEPPIRPSTITGRKSGTGLPVVDRDIEVILLTALEKDREKRYASAADLRADIQRCLNKEPIAARPPTMWTRAMRWITQHPKAFTGVACFVLGLMITAMVTLLPLWLTSIRPHSIKHVLDEGNICRAAQLRSITDRVITQWTAKPPGSIVFAELMDVPGGFLSNRIAVLGFERAFDQPHPNAVRVFDAYPPHSLLWESYLQNETPLPPSEEHTLVAADFQPHLCRLFDVFPEPPGVEPVDELVVTFSCVWSQRILRIYSAEGTLLYQVWQNGGIGDMYWMSEPGLLICLGLDESLKSTPICQSLVEPLAPYVFALRPKLNCVKNEYISFDDGTSPLHAVWCRYLLPPEALNSLTPTGLDPPMGSVSCFNHVGVRIRVRDDPKNGFSKILDQDGMESCEPIVSDKYRTNLAQYPVGHPKRLPDPDEVYFGDHPDKGGLRRATTQPDRASADGVMSNQTQ